jgi:hypothetical protein
MQLSLPALSLFVYIRKASFTIATQHLSASLKCPDEYLENNRTQPTSSHFYRIPSPTPGMLLARILDGALLHMRRMRNVTENKSSLRKGKCFSYSRRKSCCIQTQQPNCAAFSRFHVFCGLAPELQFLAGISHESRTAPHGDSHNVIFQIRPGRSYGSI